MQIISLAKYLFGQIFGWPNYSVDQIIRLTKLFGWPNYLVDQIIRLTKLFGTQPNTK